MKVHQGREECLKGDFGMAGSKALTWISQLVSIHSRFKDFSIILVFYEYTDQLRPHGTTTFVVEGGMGR